MCGRYYVDDETVKEIEKLVWQIDGIHAGRTAMLSGRVKAGDICHGKANVP